MKKIISIFVPLATVLVIIFFIPFSCSRNDTSSYRLFGNLEKSPLAEESETTRACEIQGTFRKIFELYKDRVVFITTEQIVKVRPHPFFDDPFMREFFGRSQPQYQKRKGLGTGFIISEDGYICTNHHVIAQVDSVYVNIDSKTYKAEIIGSDERTDIALLKIKSSAKLEPVYFGDSDKVAVGDWAIAIGNPFGLDRTFTVGVISATGRKDVDLMGGSHIQTDASINPGNSGGPLINIYGEVIGINRMIYSQSGGYMGIGFAIPVNTARSILEQLKQYKKIKRGFIGVSIVQLTEEYARDLGLKNTDGAFIGEVINGGPAQKGGVKVGDVITKIEDSPIKDFNDLLRVVSDAPIGKTLKLTVWRNGKTIVLYVKVAERPE
ncbi:MAG TPA: trypsin-like peptidase domain-containing protein [Spirochaetota bacterium]|nr:trypsin-like peptidase domain-containing protein [Spirochaetota bacterium]HPI87716.1 trypsin-like peptidase domain-containing protein [Spirochaetota bacterium]HPR48159.1 trypsin-like peptidase domain-containing protein [Spirochaetota bacterium]